MLVGGVDDVDNKRLARRQTLICVDVYRCNICLNTFSSRSCPRTSVTPTRHHFELPMFVFLATAYMIVPRPALLPTFLHRKAFTPTLSIPTLSIPPIRPPLPAAFRCRIKERLPRHNHHRQLPRRRHYLYPFPFPPQPRPSTNFLSNC